VQADQLIRDLSYPIDVIAAPPEVHPQVAAIGPTQARKCLRERRDGRPRPGIVFVARQKHADAPHAVALLRVRRERPGHHAAEKGDEIAAADHSITSSARNRNDEGMVRPIILAALRLTTKRNLVGFCTGNSLTLAPRKIRST